MTDPQGDMANGRPDHVLVVGGAGDIGRAVVERFEAAGAEVTVADRTATDDRHDRDRSVRLDVTDTGAVGALADRVAASGAPLRHVVSLAGGALDEEFEPLASTSASTIDESIRLNLTSHVQLVRALVPVLGASDGDRSVTVVSSINAIRDYGLPAYSAAKAGLLGLVVSLTSELGAAGIRINAVLPGTVRTRRTSAEPKDFGALTTATALGRLATMREVADVVHGLTRFTAVTGQAITVDCGQSLRTRSWRSGGTGS